MNENQIDLIKLMVRSNVLCFGKFITKSGRESPYFLNAGNYRTGKQISELGKIYAYYISENIGVDFDGLFGPAYKGIPLAVTTAIALEEKYSSNKYFSFNRKEKKDHGEGGEIIGQIPSKGDRLIIVEDVTTAGTSIHETMTLLSSIKGIKVSDLVVSMDRQEYGYDGKMAKDEINERYGIKFHAIITISQVIDYLYHNEVDKTRFINDKMMDAIKLYQSTYCKF